MLNSTGQNGENKRTGGNADITQTWKQGIKIFMLTWIDRSSDRNGSPAVFGPTNGKMTFEKF